MLAGVGTPEIWAALQEVLFEEGQREAEALVALSQPFVVKASIQSALTPEGLDDRKMLLQRTGFVPTPKNLFFSLPNLRSLDASSHETKVQVNVLPPVEGMVKRMSERFGEQKALPPPSEEEEEGEEEEE